MKNYTFSVSRGAPPHQVRITVNREFTSKEEAQRSKEILKTIMTDPNNYNFGANPDRAAVIAEYAFRKKFPTKANYPVTLNPYIIPPPKEDKNTPKLLRFRHNNVVYQIYSDQPRLIYDTIVLLLQEELKVAQLRGERNKESINRQLFDSNRTLMDPEVLVAKQQALEVISNARLATQAKSSTDLEGQPATTLADFALPAFDKKSLDLWKSNPKLFDDYMPSSQSSAAATQTKSILFETRKKTHVEDDLPDINFIEQEQSGEDLAEDPFDYIELDDFFPSYSEKPSSSSSAAATQSKSILFETRKKTHVEDDFPDLDIEFIEQDQSGEDLAEDPFDHIELDDFFPSHSEEPRSSSSAAFDDHRPKSKRTHKPSGF